VAYLEKGYDFSEESLYAAFSKISLGKKEEFTLTFSHFSELASRLQIDVDSDELYRDFCCLRLAFDGLNKNQPEGDIWAQFFKKVRAPALLTLMSFILSLPVSNAFIERVFSHVAHLWSKERNRMEPDLVKAEIQVRP